MIGLLSRAITEPGGSFLLVLGPTFSALLADKSLLTNVVGTEPPSINECLEALILGTRFRYLLALNGRMAKP